jgi:class 3 adenylate cyclase
MKLPMNRVHHFIPHPIHDAYRDGILSGSLQAATLFMDVSGFTAMTQLIQQGMESRAAGAELMTLRSALFFAPIVDAIYTRGGTITGFAGDGITAFFPEGDAHSALDAAFAIREVARKQRVQETPYGTVHIAVKQGLSLGDVRWEIVGPEEQRTYYYRGEGIDGCAASEHQADKDEIVLDAAVLSALPDALDAEALDAGYYRVETVEKGILSPKRNLPPLHNFSLEVARNFYPESFLRGVFTGEFTEVSTVFISFEGDPAPDLLDAFLSAVIRAVREQGGYFAEVDFGDKGGLLLTYFGIPPSPEDNIAQALACIQSLRSLELELPWRAGIAQGLAYAGLQGGPIRSKYTCMGSYVNLASRLMSKAEFGQTLVSESVAANPAYLFRELGPMDYKGFPEPILTFALDDPTFSS